MFAAASSAIGQPAFEVVSIRPAPPQPAGHTDTRMSTDPQRLLYTNVSLKQMLMAAYEVPELQVIGPDWIDSVRFDVTAKIPEGAQKQVPAMLQAMLAERFRVTAHRETKEMSGYALTVGKNGSKMEHAEKETGSSINSDRTLAHMNATIPMSRLAERL